MEEKKKPGRPLSVIYADAKQAITRHHLALYQIL